MREILSISVGWTLQNVDHNSHALRSTFASCLDFLTTHIQWGFSCGDVGNQEESQVVEPTQHIPISSLQQQDTK